VSGVETSVSLNVAFPFGIDALFGAAQP
jgi:hypothetical protein